ncbi:MAG TPA: ABC transporter permease subunit, partial [Chryseosolibacter sp.]
GTLELLLTKPLSDWDVILGKFFACFFLVILSLIPTLIYYFSVYALGNPVGNIDTAGVMGSYVGLVFLGAVFCSIGIFSSSLTSSQIVSFILSAFLCYILFAGFDSLSLVNVWSEKSLFIKQLGLLYHYEALSKGLIDSRHLVYFASLIGLLLLFTRIILGARSW